MSGIIYHSMDQQMQTPSVTNVPPPHMHQSHQRRVLLIIIIVAALLAVGWVYYMHLIKPLTPEEVHSVIVKSLNDETANTPPINDATRAQIIKSLKEENAAAAQANGSSTTQTSSSGPSASERAQIINSLSK